MRHRLHFVAFLYSQCFPSFSSETASAGFSPGAWAGDDGEHHGGCCGRLPPRRFGAAGPWLRWAAIGASRVGGAAVIIYIRSNWKMVWLAIVPWPFVIKCLSHLLLEKLHQSTTWCFTEPRDLFQISTGLLNKYWKGKKNGEGGVGGGRWDRFLLFYWVLSNTIWIIVPFYGSCVTKNHFLFILKIEDEE